MENQSNGRFRIIRKESATPLHETDAMDTTGITQIARAGFDRMAAAGMGDGSTIKQVFAIPGMSVVHCWFKSGFPLPLHSHSADCFYYILAGDLQFGTETIGSGDGFFLPGGMPYAYTAGSQGVELLEIRTSDKFDMKCSVENPAAWDKAVELVAASRDRWLEERPPRRA